MWIHRDVYGCGCLRWSIRRFNFCVCISLYSLSLPLPCNWTNQLKRQNKLPDSNSWLQINLSLSSSLTFSLHHRLMDGWHSHKHQLMTWLTVWLMEPTSDIPNSPELELVSAAHKSIEIKWEITGTKSLSGKTHSPVTCVYFPVFAFFLYFLSILSPRSLLTQ